MTGWYVPFPTAPGWHRNPLAVSHPASHTHTDTHILTPLPLQVVTPAEATLTGADTLSLPGTHLTVCQFGQAQWSQTPFVRVRCLLKRMVLSFPRPPGTVPDRLVGSSPVLTEFVLPEFVCLEY